MGRSGIAARGESKVRTRGPPRRRQGGWNFCVLDAYF